MATTAILHRAAVDGRTRRRLMIVGLAASVAPDLDLLYFLVIDHRRHVHHAYLTHIPLAVLLGLAAVAVVLRIRRTSRQGWIAFAVLGVNLMLHLMLDTVAGGIRWLWPWSQAELSLFHPAAQHRMWILNFVLHPSFVLEVALVAAAAWVMLARRRSAPTGA